MITYILKLINEWLDCISSNKEITYKSVNAGSSIKSLYNLYRKD
nr:MAG TPA: hypothetical protein [Caudoviricetes sp.]